MTTLTFFRCDTIKSLNKKLIVCFIIIKKNKKIKKIKEVECMFYMIYNNASSWLSLEYALAHIFKFSNAIHL